MKTVGIDSAPLRVAIVGAGPAGFYTAEHLLKQKQIKVEVDIFDLEPFTASGCTGNPSIEDHQRIAEALIPTFKSMLANTRAQ